MTDQAASAWLEFIREKHGFGAADDDGGTATKHRVKKVRSRRRADDEDDEAYGGYDEDDDGYEPTPDMRPRDMDDDEDDGDCDGDGESSRATSSKLSGSVGKGCRNAPDDVTLVQTLLNDNGQRLAVDGQCGPATIRGICAFQTKQLGMADGVIEPGGSAWMALNGKQQVESDDEDADAEEGDGGGGATERLKLARIRPRTADDDDGGSQQRAQLKINPSRRVVKRMADEAARVAALGRLRAAETAMKLAYSRTFRQPKLLAEANGLARTDREQARRIYGRAWTQRALAKKAHDRYESPEDSASQEELSAAQEQVTKITRQMNLAVALFKKGDERR